MKSSFRTGRRPQEEKAELTYEESLRFDLQLAVWELENAYAGFDYATEPDLIDCYIYQLNAAMKRYKYLLEKYENPCRRIRPPPQRKGQPLNFP